MPFKYACFVSYRRTNQVIVERFVKDLVQGLSYELAPLLDLDVFADISGTQPGDFYERELASALCESVCMIAVFTPTYFSAAYPYCAREYKAMEILEKQRIQALGPMGGNFGMIIPAVLRGFDQLPEEIKAARQVYNFDKFLLGDSKIYRSPGFRKNMAEIAQYIFRLHSTFRSIEWEPATECAKFQLPSEAEVRPWLTGISVPRPEFPFRGEVG